MSGERNVEISKHARLENLGLSILGGGLFGTIVGYPASLLSGNGPELGVGTGVVVTGGCFAMTHGIISVEEALDKRKANKIWKSRLSLTRAYLEASTGLAISFGIPGHAIGGDIGMIIGALFGISVGITGINYELNIRSNTFPELITPEGNSTQRCTNIPTSVNWRLYPPVYQAKSLSDWVTFRESNIEIVLKWAGQLPKISANPTDCSIISDEGPVNSVVVLESVEHRPVYDPENSPAIHIADKDNNGAEVLTLPTDATPFWNQESRFLGTGLGIVGKVLPDKEWLAFKENSWSRSVVVLDQYQSSDDPKSKQSLESIESRYWLLDVYGEGIKNAKRQKVAKPVMIPEFNPGNI